MFCKEKGEKNVEKQGKNYKKKFKQVFLQDE